MNNERLHIVILAAGEGTRMKSRLPKVLQPVGGQAMLLHLLQTAMALEPAQIHIVHGAASEKVQAACADYSVKWALQEQRNGTGHAVMQAMPQIPDGVDVLVLYGDHPLIPVQTLQNLIKHTNSPLAVLSMILDDPTGYGRIERDRTERIIGVVEEKDTTPSQRAITEVNTGIIHAEASRLRRWLLMLDCDNAQKEYLLTDIFSIAHSEGVDIQGVLAKDPKDLQGANDRIQLAALERHYQQRQSRALMEAGVHLMDPERVDVRGKIEVGKDVCIDVNVILEGEVSLGDGVCVHSGCVIRNSHLAAGTVVHPHSLLEGVTTSGACDIGPFARLRPGTELAEGSKIGNFVEVKNTQVGTDSKASHLSYLGDATVGAGVNIGAGTITCNYDGANKHKTVIEDDVFVGSDSQLVAPVTIEKGATIGAGSTVTKDAPADSLTVSRSRQTSIKGWQRPKKQS